MKIFNQNRLLKILPMILIVVFLSSSQTVSASDNDKKNTEAEQQGWMEWGEKYWPTKPVRGGVLRSASPYYIGVMNPNHFPVMDWFTMANMYEKLIYLDSSQRPTIPWLATSWQYIDDVTVVMELRQGVQFHDGSMFNAHSLKYQFDWIMNKDNMAWSRSMLEPLKSVEVVGEYTVKWHFKRPWGAFLGTLASVPGMMISAEALKNDELINHQKKLKRQLVSMRRKAQKGDLKAKEKLALIESELKEIEPKVLKAKPLDTNPVGSGQFMHESASPGNYVKLLRNPNWWFGKSVGHPEMPYFDGIKVTTIPDPSVRLANLRAGTLDFINVNPIQYRLVQKDKRINVGVIPLNWLVFMTFNHNKGPCQDIRVRKAISHAIDRKALVMGTQFGLGRIASCLFPEGHWAHNSKLSPVPFDPELSKKLLKEAGYEKGLILKGFTLNTPEAQAFAKAIMAMLKKVGIEWKPTFLGVAAMAEPFRSLKYDMIGMMYQWIQEPDHIATFMYHPDSPFNNGRTQNKRAVELIEKGRQERDEEKRIKIYNELETVLYNNYEDAWLWYPMIVTASNKKLQGYNPDMARKWGEGYAFSHPGWFKDGER